MREILNGMLQAQAAGLAMVKMKTWQDHFADVCREAGLVVRDGYNRTGDTLLTIESPTGAEIDLKPLCTEASNRTFGGTSARIEDPFGQAKADKECGREEWDRKVDAMEDAKEAAAQAERDREEAARAGRRAKLLEMLKTASSRAEVRGDFPSALAFEIVRITIEKGLI